MTNNATNDFKDERDIILNALGDSPPTSPFSPSPKTANIDSLTATPSQTTPQKQGENTNINELIQQFAATAEQNSATVEILTDENAVPSAIANYMRRHQIVSAICTPEWEHLNWAAAKILVESRAAQGDDICGIGGILAAAADCGAMLTDNACPQRLTASLLPPHHIAIVRADTVLPSLNEILAIYANAPPNKIALLCGPSRTADIEQTLILGVHGPLAVHVLIV